MVMSVVGNFIGTMAIVKDMLNYLRISKAQSSGFATPGDELGSTVPGLC